MVARRVINQSVVERTPQRIDSLSACTRYDTASEGVSTAAPQAAKRVTPLDRVKRSISRPLKRLVRWVVRRHRGGFDPRFFQPLDPTGSERSPKKSLVRPP